MVFIFCRLVRISLVREGNRATSRPLPHIESYFINRPPMGRCIRITGSVGKQLSVSASVHASSAAPASPLHFLWVVRRRAPESAVYCTARPRAITG